MQVTVSTIANTAMTIANNENSQFIDMSDSPTSEIMQYLNLAYEALYNKLIDCRELYFASTFNITTTGSTPDYNLPTDFYKILGVDLNFTTDQSATVYPTEFGSRNRFKSGFFIPATVYGTTFRYILLGSTIRFLPTPQITQSLTLWYYPEPAIITTLSQIIAIPPGSVEYMAIYVAIIMKLKAEEDVSMLGQRLTVLEASLRSTFKDRDSGNPHQIRDVSSESFYNFNPGDF